MARSDQWPPSIPPPRRGNRPDGADGYDSLVGQWPDWAGCRYPGRGTALGLSGGPGHGTATKHTGAPDYGKHSFIDGSPGLCSFSHRWIFSTPLHSLCCCYSRCPLVSERFRVPSYASGWTIHCAWRSCYRWSSVRRRCCRRWNCCRK